MLGPWVQIEEGRAILVWFTGSNQASSQGHVLEIEQGQSVTFLRGVQLHWYIINPMKKYYRMLHATGHQHFSISCADCTLQCGTDYYVIPGPSRPHADYAELGEICSACYKKYDYQSTTGHKWQHIKDGAPVQDRNTEKGAAGKVKKKTGDSAPVQGRNTEKGAAGKVKKKTGDTDEPPLCCVCLNSLGRPVPYANLGKGKGFKARGDQATPKLQACSRCMTTTIGGTIPHFKYANLEVDPGLSAEIQEVLAKELKDPKKQRRRELGTSTVVVKLDGKCEEWPLGDRDCKTGGPPDAEWENRGPKVKENEDALGPRLVGRLDTLCRNHRQNVEEMCDAVWVGPIPEDGRSFCRARAINKGKPGTTGTAAKPEPSDNRQTAARTGTRATCKNGNKPQTPRATPARKTPNAQFKSQWHFGSFAIISSKGEPMGGQQPHIDLEDGQVGLHLAA